MSLKRSPLKRSTKPIQRKTPIKTTRKARPKIDGIDYPGLCRGQRCYLMLDHVVFHDVATVVPAHSNQYQHGKGFGLKASDVYTVPACHACHYELDQGKDMTREAKAEAWNRAYEKWKEDRERMLHK
jgi:hypothetical protein